MKRVSIKFRVPYILSRMTALFMILILLGGCGLFGGKPASNEGTGPMAPAPKVDRYTGEKSREIPYVYTAKKELALTFNGMGDRATMTALIDELDAWGIKATFFLPGMRVAEEPDIASAILARGHEIENNTLNQLDMNKLDYDQIYKEIKLANDVIKRETGAEPRYVRTRSGDYPADVPLAAAHLGMKAVVSYNINPKDRNMQSAEEIGEYVAKFISRGGIISMNTDVNPEVISSIQYIAQAADDIGYQLVTLNELVENGGERKPLEQIPGYDAARINPDYQQAKYELVYKVDTNKKEVALTFDDFGSDKTVTRILDILAEHDVKATFFLRAKGVESNPNLARAMVEGGHDVANHSYSHPVVTSLTPQELQEDVVKAHQVITEAIQQQPVMLFRPPTGVVDDERAKALAAVGYPVIAMYDVTTLDWDISNSAKDIVNGVMTKTERGSVILLHMLDDIHTIEALPSVLEGLQGKGYTFVKMADMMQQNKAATEME
ncbi:polysaccharide deacetylase family protein [Paenibacillus glucanolyticus]|uniref:polysaccharide deacetylase family protein n=1 Tax=Paenibacillus TaxID=44249 RepID=UPI001164033D|nr:MULTISPECIES: polysaccharide deacetylase family protein [unclassified Paenibacillus]AWP28559.1 chitin deacetylase [Paenibacillus sp. Cedars]MDH6671706.1 peptidoglycan/xylan/chitin deacetylase (PgdA/CDA1 family) [Paenibacillus sp. LBL]